MTVFHGTKLMVRKSVKSLPVIIAAVQLRNLTPGLPKCLKVGGA